MKHAKLSASGSPKWFYCAGSVEAEKQFPNSTNEFAELGTLAHELSDVCFKNNKDAIEYIGKEISCESDGKLLKIIVDKEMATYVQEYLDYVRSYETDNSKLYTEERVDFSNIVPEGFGTMDSAVLDYDTGVCNIFDLKYGMTPVVAENNTQGLLYCVGLYNELKFLDIIESFKIHIVQPRINSITSWDVSLDYLTKFSMQAKHKAKLALSKDAKRTPGDKQCQWCNARFTCDALDNYTNNLTIDYFDNMENIKSGIISDERVKEILDNKSLIIKFLNEIEKHTLQRLIDGDEIPGYKIVQGRSNRKWTDEAEETLVSTLGDEAYSKKLLTLTKAKKLLDKEVIEELTFKAEGKLELAREDDKRPAVTNTIDEFDNLESK